MLTDLRLALRGLARRPSFAAVVTLTLGLGVAVHVVVFSFVRAVLLAPLPFPDADRLVVLRDVQPQAGDTPLSYPEFLDWRARGELFADVAAYARAQFTLTGTGEPERVTALRTASSLLPVLGVEPALGRGFLPTEDPPGQDGVALLGHAFWQRRFAGDPGVLGTTLLLDGRPRTVVGVLPPGLTFGPDRDLWVPLGLDEARAPEGLHFLEALGRLRPDLELAGTGDRLEAAAAAIDAERGRDHSLRLTRLHDSLVARVKPAFLGLYAAVTAVLLLACANVAGLLLARGAARKREIAVRRSLGAGTGRLFTHLLTESVVLAGLGAAVGVVLAAWGVEALGRIVAGRLPRIDAVAIDGPVLLYALGLALVTGLAFGLAPAFQALRVDLAAPLAAGRRGTTAGSGSRRVRDGLVVAEIALSLVLLVGAGLLLRSFAGVLATPPGFEPDRLLTLTAPLPTARYSEPARQEEFYRALRERLAALPGVTGVSEVSHLPMDGSSTNGNFAIEGRPDSEADSPIADKLLVGPDSFAVMGIPIVAGRGLSATDGPDAPRVAAINAEAARRFFPGEDPVGKRLDFSWGEPGWREIVGVVGDVRQAGLDGPPAPALYIPFAQALELQIFLGRILVIRTAVSPESLAPAARAAVAALDPDLPTEIRTASAVVDDSLGPRRLATQLLTILAAVALVLAAVGLYGVIAYLVAQRSHEFGVRMALGARPADVTGQVLGRGLWLAAIGIGLGGALALAATRSLAGYLVGVSTLDATTWSAVAAVLLAAALTASALPARRAARVDPVTALRGE